jgi:hypothetical protein
MLNEEFLLDSWDLNGNNIEDFKELIKEMEAKTLCMRVNSEKLSVLSVTGSNGGAIYCNLMAPYKIWIVKDKHYFLQNSMVSKGNIMEKGDFESLIKEAENKTKLILVYDNTPIFTSAEFPLSVFQQYDETMCYLDKPSLGRDISMAERFEGEKEVTIILRTINSISKVYAMRSSRYLYIRQSILLDIMEEIQKREVYYKEEYKKEKSEKVPFVCRAWHIDNKSSWIELEFQSLGHEIKRRYDFNDDIVPGVKIITSDTGFSSLRIQSIWRISNTICIEHEFSRKHTGTKKHREMSEEFKASVFDEMNQEILTKYVELPQKLFALKTVILTEGEKTAASYISRVLKHAFKTVKMTAAISKQRSIKLESHVMEKLDYSKKITAYDLVIQTIDSINELKDIPITAVENMKKAITKLVYVPFS